MKAVSGGTTTNLVYDPLGRLFETNQGSSATTTRFLNDGDAMVAELNSSNVITNRLVHGSNAAADDPLVWYVGGTMTIKRWLHGDHLGSIVAVTNSSGGSPSINRYDEYGVPASTNIGRFQYTGQAWIGELGLYYYKARFYSPALGRFMQTDPVGYEDQINLYAYVGNDPVNQTDVSGLAADESCGSRLPDAAAPGCFEIPMLIAGAEDDPAKRQNKPADEPTDTTGESEETTDVEVAQRFTPRVPPSTGVLARPPIFNPKVPFPGFRNTRPGPGWEWRGPADKGAWYNPRTGESLRPDFHHPPGIRPHWDYKAPDGSKWRWFGPREFQLVKPGRSLIA